MAYICYRRSSVRSSRAFNSNTEVRGSQRVSRLAETFGRGRARSPPPTPESPPPESAAAERPESPTVQPITTHLLEMGFTAPHIRRAVEALGMHSVLTVANLTFIIDSIQSLVITNRFIF